MVTTVGLSKDFNTVIADLVSLEYDAIAAYDAAIERFESPALRAQFQEFVGDHRRHLQDLSALATRRGIEIPTGPDLKKLLTKGKVVMADLFGDRAVLMAMKTNEEDTVSAYERAFNHENLPPEAIETVERGFTDERRHRAWIADSIAQLPQTAAPTSSQNAA